MSKKITGNILLYFFIVSHAFLHGMESSLDCNQETKKRGKKVQSLFHYCLHSTLNNKFFKQSPKEIKQDLTLLNDDIQERLVALVNKPLNKDYGHTRLHKAHTALRIRQLLAIGASAHALTRLQETPLVSLLKENKIAEALALLEYAETLDVNQTDADGINALAVAFNLKDMHLIEALRKQEATSAFFDDMRRGWLYCRQKVVNFWDTRQENDNIEKGLRCCMGQPTLDSCKNYFRQLPLKMQEACAKSLNNPLTSYGHTYFHLAQTAGDVEKLLDLQADCRMLTKMHEEPLHYMIKCGNRKAALALLPHLQEDGCNTIDLFRLTPLCSAARVADTSLVLALLQKGADAAYVYNSKDCCISPFHLVAPYAKKYKIMRALFNKGGKIISHDMRLDLMCLAVEHGNPYMLTRLIRGRTLDTFFGNMNLVLYALHKRRMACVQKLLSGEAKVCEKSLDGATILQQTKPACVQFSLANSIGITPLMVAVENGDCDTVEQLIRLGVALDAADYKGRTALIYAINREDLVMAALLLNGGANKDRADNVGATPLHYAVGKESIAVTQLLLDAGADFTKTNDSGKTPLSIATTDKLNPFLVKSLRAARRNKKPQKE